MTNIQNISDETLLRVINEGGEIPWNYFALKVMISRLKLMLKMASNKEETKQQCYNELRKLFTQSANIPNANKDLQNIIELFDGKQ